MAIVLQVVIIEVTAEGDVQCSDNCEFIVTRPTHPVLYTKLKENQPQEPYRQFAVLHLGSGMST